jgi:integrase/recombinase XerD
MVWGSGRDGERVEMDEENEVIKMNLLIAAFAQDCKLRRFTSRTIENYIDIINQYISFLESYKTDVITAEKDDLINYLATLQARNLKESYIDQMFVALRSFYDFLVEKGKIQVNPIDPFRKRYLRKFKNSGEQSQRKCLTVEEASKLFHSITDTRDKTILLLLFKTGMRIHELRDLDVSDVDMVNSRLIVKPTPKRSNRILFFDDEVKDHLALWLKVRETRALGNPALFVFPNGKRMKYQIMRIRIEKYATKIGLHNPTSKRPEDKFTPHCTRHWFTTHLIRSGMPRDYVKELRGDVRREAIDIYNHIDEKALKESYLAHIPRLGI